MKRLSAREQRKREGQATEARLSARYAALAETAAHIWELRTADKRREEIEAIIEELLEDADEDLRAYYKKLIAIRRAHPALTRGEYERLYWEGDLLVFQRQHAESGDTVIVAANRGSAELQADIQTPSGWTGSVTEAVTGSAIEGAGDKFPVTVPGMSVRIYTD